MTLYEEVDAIENAIAEMLYGDDELNIDALDTLLSARDATIQSGMESLCKIRARRIADIDAIKAEILRLGEKSARETRALARLENYIMNVLKRSGEPKITAGTFTVGTRKSTSVYVAPDFNNPEYMRVKTTTEPDKTAIRDALKSGAEIPGAYLTEKENLAIK